MSYESGRSFIAPMVVGALIGNLVSGAIRAATDNADARVRGVQINNAQLYDQLSEAHEVEGLLLNDSDHTFTYRSHTATGQAETCDGSYEVRNDVAQVSGPLACTQIVEVR